MNINDTSQFRRCLLVPLLLLLLQYLCGVVQSLSSLAKPPQLKQQQSISKYTTCIKPTNDDDYVASVLEWLDVENITWRFVMANDSEYNNNPTGCADQRQSHACNIPTQFCSIHSTRVELIDSSILLHLVPTPSSLETTLPPTLNKKLTDWVAGLSTSSSSSHYKKIIHLHQDIWLAKNAIVKSRLLVQSGTVQTQRVFARKTIGRRLNATEARSFLAENHLWGATKAKHHYGLYREKPPEINKKRRRRPRRSQAKEEELVAVATFSRVRHVQRNNRPFKSHELLRYCSLRDCTVVGGISKLIKSFEREVHPDDIVTMVDRDWGEADGWRIPHQLGFETMTVLDPLVMAISPKELGVRRYFVGAGLKQQPQNTDAILSSNEKRPTCRLGLPTETRAALDDVSDDDDASEALRRLANDDYYPVYDAGVERLYKLVSDDAISDARQRNESAKILWRTAEPKYVTQYYSNNSGIVSLLEYAARKSPPLDNISEFEAIDSWRSTSGTASAAPVIRSLTSSMDPDAVIEIRARAGGWRTLGIFGSKRGVSSIYHGIYKVDEGTGNVEPDVIVSEQIKSMAALSLAGLLHWHGSTDHRPSSGVIGGDDASDHGPLRFLHFGYGAGTLVRLLAHRVTNSHHVAVELDQGVVDATKELKPDLPNVSVVVQDALEYVQQYYHSDKNLLDVQQQRFHCICIDVFDEKNLVPDQFYSEPFLQTLRDHVLTPDGILVQNFHSGGKKRGAVIQAASENLRRTFRDVASVPSIDSRENAGNLLVMASKVPITEDGDGNISLERNSLRAQMEFGFGFDMVARVQNMRRAEGSNC